MKYIPKDSTAGPHHAAGAENRTGSKRHKQVLDEVSICEAVERGHKIRAIARAHNTYFKIIKEILGKNT